MGAGAAGPPGKLRPSAIAPQPRLAPLEWRWSHRGSCLLAVTSCWLCRFQHKGPGKPSVQCGRFLSSYRQKSGIIRWQELNWAESHALHIGVANLPRMHVSGLWEGAWMQEQHRRVAVDLICRWKMRLTKVDVRDTKYLHDGTVAQNIFCCVELQLQEECLHFSVAWYWPRRAKREKIDTVLCTMPWNTSN